MAGKPKQSITYAGWSVDIFDNDTKIDKLLDAHGWIGFSVYFYLCMKAFGSDGYFYKWCYDLCASTARKMGGGISAGTVQETVGYCLQIGLFDQGLFDEWGVLTSRGIQRSYWAVASKRRVRSVYKELWLLSKNESEGLIFVPINADLQQTNDYLQATNSDLQQTNDTVVYSSVGVVKGSVIESDTKVSDCSPASRVNVYQDIIDLWNTLKPYGITPIRGIDSRRRKLVKARLDQYGFDGFVEAVSKIKQSDFLQGKHGGRPWDIKFDWLILPNNFPKVLEGNYDNRGNAGVHSNNNFNLEDWGND